MYQHFQLVSTTAPLSLFLLIPKAIAMASLPAHARYTVVPIECGDLPSLLDIWAAAFEDDAHTRMKMTEKGETNVRSQLEPLQSLEASFGRPGVHMFKVVDEGRMVGFSNWREWNFDIDVSEVGAPTSPLPSPQYTVPCCTSGT